MQKPTYVVALSRGLPQAQAVIGCWAQAAWLDPPCAAQVCERPLVFLLDTPGVLAPRIESVETGLKLALCGKPHC